MKTKNKNGFTLIELLVVISIIALLLSILMPALSAAKKQALRVVCMSNLSQWGLILTLYTEDHDGHFFAGYYDYTDPNSIHYASSNSDLWPYVLESYYQVPKLMVCPSSPFKTPKIHDPVKIEEADGNLSGGYGLNGWLGDTPKEVLQTEGHDTANSWRTMDYSGGASIPLMADALWYTGRPEPHDLPSQEQGQFGLEHPSPPVPHGSMMMPGMMPGIPTSDPNSPMMPGVSGLESDPKPTPYNDWPDRYLNHMQRFAVDRHRENLNVLFMDGMVKSISPKELWRLKWHKNYDTSAPLPEWPEWMAPFKDPD